MTNTSERCVTLIEFPILHFGITETILFEWWKITTVGGLIGSCIVFVALAFIAEGIVVLRQNLLRKFATEVRRKLVDRGSTESTRLIESQAEGHISPLSWEHLLLTGVYTLNTVLYYLLMLIVMTYNVYILLSIIAGASLAYFTFAWRNSVTVDVTTLRK